jgi:transposase
VPLFVPAVVEKSSPERPSRRRHDRRPDKIHQVSGVIEMEIDGVSVRVGRGADARTVAAVIRALKAGT